MIPGVKNLSFRISRYYQDLTSADPEDFVQEGLVYLAEYIIRHNGLPNHRLPGFFAALTQRLHRFGISLLPMKINSDFWREAFKQVLYDVVSLDELMENDREFAEQGKNAVLGVRSAMTRDERIDLDNEFKKLPKRKRKIFDLMRCGYNLVQAAKILELNYSIAYYHYKSGIGMLKERGVFPSFLDAE